MSPWSVFSTKECWEFSSPRYASSARWCLQRPFVTWLINLSPPMRLVKHRRWWSSVLRDNLVLLSMTILCWRVRSFRGGLDTRHGQTGDESIYTEYHDKGIMFHVSTLLPYAPNDPQQVSESGCASSVMMILSVTPDSCTSMVVSCSWPCYSNIINSHAN